MAGPDECMVTIVMPRSARVPAIPTGERIRVTGRLRRIKSANSIYLEGIRLTSA